MPANKYGARKTQVDGITFDSRAEAKYYEQLKWLKVSKQIKDFKSVVMVPTARSIQKERQNFSED